jgi:hypothetical protein
MPIGLHSPIAIPTLDLSSQRSDGPPPRKRTRERPLRGPRAIVCAPRLPAPRRDHRSGDGRGVCAPFEEAGLRGGGEARVAEEDWGKRWR